MIRFQKGICAAMSIVLGVAATAAAQSDIDPAHKFAWGENIGWTNWQHDRPNSGDGVIVESTFLGGYVWGENLGWLRLGDGDPGAPGGTETSYTNLNGTDYGVNRDPCTDYLSGYAWGENIGWVNFSGGALATPPYPARIETTSGASRLQGYVWGENVGWINLDHALHYVGLFACPPSGGTGPAVNTYQITGDANNVGWSWRIQSNNGAFADIQECCVPGVASGGALAVAQAFANSINASGCGSALSATAFSLFGNTYLSIGANGNPFTLYVGPCPGPATCVVVFSLPAGCTFNPTITQLPLPGNDCNGNMIDDIIDLAAATSTDNNGNGIPDECEYGPGDMNCDGALDNFDIDPFVIGLVDPAAYDSIYPDCNRNNGDVNGDGSFDNFDIDAFVACLIEGGC